MRRGGIGVEQNQHPAAFLPIRRQERDFTLGEIGGRPDEQKSAGVGGNGLDVEQVERLHSQVLTVEQALHDLELLALADLRLAVALQGVDVALLALGHLDDARGDGLLPAEGGDLRLLAHRLAAAVDLGHFVVADYFVAPFAIQDHDIFLLCELVFRLHLGSPALIAERIDLLVLDVLRLGRAVLLRQIHHVIKQRGRVGHEHDQFHRLVQAGQELLGAGAERVLAVAREVEAFEMLVSVGVDHRDDEHHEHDLNDDAGADLKAAEKTGARSVDRTGGGRRRSSGRIDGHRRK